MDNVESKIKILRERTKRYGAHLERYIVADASSQTAFDREIGKQKFDNVFVDTPCRGLGTLRRHPELKWRLTAQKVKEMANKSSKILTNAADHLSENGILTYSTCTVTKSENEEVIDCFLASPTGQNFKVIPHIIQDKQFLNLRTQTFSGLNDSHFCVTLKKIND